MYSLKRRIQMFLISLPFLHYFFCQLLPWILGRFYYVICALFLLYTVPVCFLSVNIGIALILFLVSYLSSCIVLHVSRKVKELQLLFSRVDLPPYWSLGVCRIANRPYFYSESGFTRTPDTILKFVNNQYHLLRYQSAPKPSS